MLTNNNQLRILQNNLHRSQPSTLSILNHPDTKQYAILLLQEQHWQKYTNSSPRHPSWTLFEPIIQENERPRTAIYTNNNLLMAAQITPLNVSLRDITAIEILTTDSRPMLVINIYKPCDKTIIPELHEYLQRLDMKHYGVIIIAGDFNLHHPVWNPANYTTHDEEADSLVEMMADLGLDLLIPAGTATYPNPEPKTAIDLVWGNTEAINRKIKCKIADLSDHCSDHFPIQTILSVQTDTPQMLPSYNYAKTNWQELNVKLELYLSELHLGNGEISTKAQIDTYAEQLTNAITKAMQETTPRKQSSPHSKRWWTQELTDRRDEVNKLRNKYLRTKNAIDKRTWRREANKYKKKIEQAKADKWKEYINNADDHSIYEIKDYILNPFTSAFVSTLNENAATTEQKTASFQKAFFFKLFKADFFDISNVKYFQETSVNL